MKTQLECPVDFVTVNENKVRTIAFFVMVLAGIYLMTGLWVIFAFLSIDFIVRANNLGKYSLLALLSDTVMKQLKIGVKPVDQGAKRFAAMIGIVFSVAVLMLSFTQFHIAAVIVTVVLIGFAFLESILGFCAGCYVYTFLQRFKRALKIDTIK